MTKQEKQAFKYLREENARLRRLIRKVEWGASVSVLACPWCREIEHTKECEAFTQGDYGSYIK